MRCIVIVFILAWQSAASAQVKAPQSLVQTIEYIQKHYQIKINYDPEIIQNYPLRFLRENEQLDQSLKDLVFDSDLSIEKVGQIYILHKSEKLSRTLTGKVLDLSTQSPLPSAIIAVDHGIFYTDSLGNFSITSTLGENETAEVRYIGYASKKIPVHLFDSQSPVNIQLSVDQSLFNEEIVITGYLLKGVDYKMVNNEHILDMPCILEEYQSIEQDVMKTVQFLPGIKAIDDSAMNLSIRGSTPDQNLVIWEEGVVYDPGHLFGMISPVNPLMIDEVSIHKGVIDPSYDDRVGGVIDMGTLNEHPNDFQGSISLSSIDVNGLLSTSLAEDKLSLLLSARSAGNQFFTPWTLNNFSNKVFQSSKIEDEQNEQEDGFLESNYNIDFYDYAAKILFTPHSKTAIEVSLLRNYNQMNYTSDFVEDDINTQDIVNYTNTLVNSSIQQTWSRHHQTSLQFSYSDFDNRYDFTLNREGDDFTQGNTTFNRIRDWKAQWSHAFEINSNNHFMLGGEYNQKRVEFSYIEEDDTEEEVLEDTEGNFFSPFVQYTFSSERLSSIISWRSTYVREVEQYLHAPRFSLSYRLHKNLSLKGSMGRYNQFIGQVQSFYDNDLNINNNIWVLNVEENDEFLTSTKRSLGLFFQSSDWQVDIDLYQNETRGITTLTSSINRETFGDIFGTSMTKGLDLSISKNWDSWSIWANYTLSDQKLSIPDSELVEFDANAFQRHHLDIISTIKMGKWSFTSIAHFSSGLPYTIPGNIIEIDDGEELYYEIAIDNINTGRLPNIYRFDSGLGYRSDLSKQFEIEANFYLRNIFNRNNLFSRESILVEDDEAEGREILSIDKALLPLTPTFRLQINF